MRAALVLGGADCLWRDVEAALQIGEYQAVIACNDAIAAWPGPLDAAATLHPERLPLWLERRRLAGHAPPARLFGLDTFNHELLRLRPLPIQFVPQMLPGQKTTGSSGLFALKIALVELAYDKAVLCGVPMDLRPHFNSAPLWGAHRAYRAGWTEALTFLQPQARSMSGWTAELLGSPDAAWLAA